jgi:hypothetical protein
MTGPYRATGPNPDEPQVEIQPEGDPALPQEQPVPDPGPEDDPADGEGEEGDDEDAA